LSDTVRGTPLFIATSLSKVYVVSALPISGKTSLSVTTVDAVNGAVLETHKLDASVLWTDEVQVIGSHSSAPFVIWNEKGKLKVNILGSKSIATLASEVPFPAQRCP
jgi:hypothetical protein